VRERERERERENIYVCIYAYGYLGSDDGGGLRIAADDVDHWRVPLERALEVGGADGANRASHFLCGSKEKQVRVSPIT